MPEDKKADGEKPCEDAVQKEQGPHNASDEPVSTIQNEDSRRQRARNQDVLPGILGKQLRAAYSELLNAPLPDTINDLVERLKNQGSTTLPDATDKPRSEESGQ